MRAFVRQAGGVRTATCKCGLTIVADDARKVVSHEAPECAWFQEMVAAAGPSERAIEIIDVAGLTGQPGDVVRMRAMPATTLCAVHDWPTKGMGKRLVRAMRAAHGKGGVNVCTECLTRARSDASDALKGSLS